MVKDIDIVRNDVYSAAVNYGEKSDVLRCEILNIYGGVYVDVDFDVIKSLDDLVQVSILYVYAALYDTLLFHLLISLFLYDFIQAAQSIVLYILDLQYKVPANV